MQDAGVIESAVREFFVRSGLWLKEPADLTGALPLLELGVLDSLNVIGLVDFVEETYGIELEPEEIQQFTTIDNIARVIRGRLAA